MAEVYHGLQALAAGLKDNRDLLWSEIDRNERNDAMLDRILNAMNAVGWNFATTDSIIDDIISNIAAAGWELVYEK